MSYTVYQGDSQEIKVKNDMPYIPGEFVLETVRYTIKVVGQKQWYGILGNGHVIEIEPKKDNLQRVGMCTFHRTLSQAVKRYLQFGGKNTEEIIDIMKNRKRTLWEKEYRGA
jgi:hypothetical protein